MLRAIKTLPCAVEDGMRIPFDAIKYTRGSI